MNSKICKFDNDGGSDSDAVHFKDGFTEILKGREREEDEEKRKERGEIEYLSFFISERRLI